jgi:plasmid stabilization system protein ParE
MRGRFVLTPRAQADVDDIWDYTADHSALDQAETDARQLWNNIAAVADRPLAWQGMLRSAAGLSPVSLRLACPFLPFYRGRH